MNFNKLTNQQKGSLLAFIGVMFITPDSLFIRMSNIETWGMLFYRGAIPFFVVLFGLLLFYKNNFFMLLKVISFLFYKPKNYTFQRKFLDVSLRNFPSFVSLFVFYLLGNICYTEI